MAFILYQYPYSICSVMVRFTLAFRGAPKDESSAMSVEERTLNIFQDEQLSEEYLCEVNPKGQVPALTSSTANFKPVVDSLDITLFIGNRYPQLIPEEHKERIMELLHQLHEINYFSITFAGKPNYTKAAKEKIQRMLADPAHHLSERYRSALEFKLTVNEREKVDALLSGVPEKNLELARVFLVTCSELLSSEGPWLWGLAHPTALDAHLVVFIARLLDVGHGHIVPASLMEYIERVKKGSEWAEVMQGRQTIPPPRT